MERIENVVIVHQIKGGNYGNSISKYVRKLGGVIEYSTDEKVIGKWIDGKPLYQKTIVDTMPTITTNGVFATKIISASFLEDVDMVVDISSIKNWSTDYFGQIMDAYININASNPDNQLYFTRVYVDKRQKTIIVGGNRIGFSESPIYVTIQYTKTTD